MHTTEAQLQEYLRVMHDGFDLSGGRRGHARGEGHTQEQRVDDAEGRDNPDLPPQLHTYKWCQCTDLRTLEARKNAQHARENRDADMRTNHFEDGELHVADGVEIEGIGRDAAEEVDGQLLHLEVLARDEEARHTHLRDVPVSK